MGMHDDKCISFMHAHKSYIYADLKYVVHLAVIVELAFSQLPISKLLSFPFPIAFAVSLKRLILTYLAAENRVI